MNYLNIFKKCIIYVAVIITFFLFLKCTIFYIPFLIAYIISLLIDPIIRWIYKKTNFSRKICSIIVLIVIFGVLTMIIIFGGIKLITETTKLLGGLNTYLEISMDFINDKISYLKIEKLNLSNEVISIFENSASDFLNAITTYIKNFLSKILDYITSIPNMFIYIIITILATYFISSDKFYILDRMEHHLSKKMVGKIITHTKEITSTLGGYLKAELILIFITFIIVLTGLNIFYLLGMDIQYPILMALLIGFVDALPILGAGSIMIPWSIMLFFKNNTSLGLALLGLYIIILVTKQLIEPKIVSSNIGIHPIFTLIAMYTSFKFIGLLGLLIGPILLIILKNIFANFLDKGIMSAITDS